MFATTSPNHTDLIVPTTIEQVPAVYRKGNGVKFAPRLESYGEREARRQHAEERNRLALAEAMAGSETGHAEAWAMVVLAAGTLLAAVLQWGA